MPAEMPPPGSALRRRRAVVLLAVGLCVLLTSFFLWNPYVTERKAPIGTTITTPARDGEMARLRELVLAVVHRVVVLHPGEGLPPHFVDREYVAGPRSSYDRHNEPVSPDMLFEEAIRNAAIEKGLGVEPTRAALRDFADRVRAGGSADLFDRALAGFAERDYPNAERLAAKAAAREQTGLTTESGQEGAALRQREALLLEGDACMLQSKFWEAESSYRAALRLVAKTDAAAWIAVRWKTILARDQRGAYVLPHWETMAAACASRLGPNDRATLAARFWAEWELGHAERWRREREPSPLASIVDEQKARFGPEDLDVAQGLLVVPSRNFLASTQEALAIFEKRLGPEHPATLRSLRWLARVGGSGTPPENFAIAERAARRALAISEKLFGLLHLEVAYDAQQLAELLPREKNAAEIESLHQRVFIIRQKGTPDDERGLLGTSSEIEQTLRQRLAEARREHGSERLKVAECLLRLGQHLSQVRDREHWMQEDLKRKPPAGELDPYRQAVAISNALLGDSPEEVASLPDRLALLRVQKESLEFLKDQVDPEVAKAEHLDYRYQEAFSSLLKAKFEQAESLLGSEHPDVADYLDDYADSIDYWKKPADAEPLFRRAAEIRLKVFGAQDWGGVYTLYKQNEARGQLGESEILARRMVALQEDCPDRIPSEVASRLADLAGILRKEGKLQEVEPLLRRALALWDSAPTKAFRHDQIEGVEKLARILRVQGQLAEAASLFRRVLSLILETGVNWEPTGLRNEIELAEVLGDLGQFEEAEVLIKKGENYWGMLEPNDAIILEAEGRRGVLLAQQGKFNEARKLISDALAELKNPTRDRSGESPSSPVFVESGTTPPTPAMVEYQRQEDALKPRARFEKYLAETDAALAKLPKAAPVARKK